MSSFRTRWCAGSLLVAACAASSSHELSPADVRGIRSTDSAYVSAWLRDDTAGVLSTLAPDVVLMPAGQRPLTTPTAIRNFWWPQDSSRTTILTFTRVIDEIAGDGDLAFIRGSDSLTFRYEKGKQRSEQTSLSMTLAMMERQRDGSWKIKRMMWGTRSR